jgi:hypothetical protein
MTPDFRALCAELIRAIDSGHGWQFSLEFRDAVATTRAALASVPQGPTDEELLRLYQVATPCYAVKEYERELDFARAVLARWGNTSPRPIPVTERLPTESDCDSDGNCWRLDNHYKWGRCHWRIVGKFGDTHWLPHHALPLPEQK